MVRIINQVQFVRQSVGISGYPQQPLGHFFLAGLGPATLAAAVNYFFVSQTDFTARTPINRHFLLVSQAALKKLEKNPLGPMIISRIGGVHFPFPVVSQAKALHLLFKAGDIFFGGRRRVNAGLNGVIFRRQTKSVPAHRIKRVFALHPAFAGQNIHYRESKSMTQMKPAS